MTYTRQQATVWLWLGHDAWDGHGRIYVRWRSAGHWEDVRLSLKVWFGRGVVRFDPLRKLWYLPVDCRAELAEWLAQVFEREAVVWCAKEPTGWFERAGRAG